MKSTKTQGFTVIELLVSFTLTALVMTFLFEVVISLKNLYHKTEVQTELISKQSLISRLINEDFANKKISKIERCNGKSNCYNIYYYKDETMNVNNTETITLSIESSNVIRYGDNAYIKLDDNSRFGTISIVVNDIDNDNQKYGEAEFGSTDNIIMKVTIPITNTTLDKDFDVYAVYQNNI